MTPTRRPLLRLLPATLLALPLAGCISFGPKPPPTLMTIHSAQVVQPGAARTGDDSKAVAVATPTAEPTLMTQRVMVQSGDNSVAYLKDALWAAAPTALMRNVLAETIMAKTGRIVPEQRMLSLQPDTRLSGKLVAFGLDGPGMAVMVTFEGTIMHAGSNQVETRRFSARLPVSAEDAATVGAALDKAANQVAGEVADWIGTR